MQGILTGIGILLIFVGLPIAAIITGIATKKLLAAKIGGTALCAEAMFVIWFFIQMFATPWGLMDAFGMSVLWLSPAVCTGLLLLCLLLIWKPFAVKPRRIATVSIAGVMVIAIVAVGGIQGYKNSFVEVPDGDSEINLYKYRPFSENSLARKLDEPCALSLGENLPRIDGATALYPLYASFVQAAYPEGNYSVYDDLSQYSRTFDEYLESRHSEGDPDWTDEDRASLLKQYNSLSPVVCSRTQGAFENLIDGYADIVFLMDVSDEQRKTAENLGLELNLTPIGKEAFVFLVNSNNEIDGLGQDEIRAIYSGELTDWSEIGNGTVKGKIDAYQRPEGSGSQTALIKLMSDTPILPPQETQVYDMMMGLYNAVADYKNYKTAIGYSFRYYIESMLNDAEMNKVKLLAIDGVAPTTQNIANGRYPFTYDFYAVTVSNRVYKDDTEKAVAENTQKLIDWILSEQGQSLVEKTGYVPFD